MNPMTKNMVVKRREKQKKIRRENEEAADVKSLNQVQTKAKAAAAEIPLVQVETLKKLLAKSNARNSKKK